MLFNDPHLLPEITIHLLKTNILLDIRYGCESWNTTSSKKFKLWFVQQAMERCMRGINMVLCVTSGKLLIGIKESDTVEMTYG